MSEDCNYCLGARLVGWSGAGPILCPECSRGQDAFHVITQAWREQRVMAKKAQAENDRLRERIAELEAQVAAASAMARFVIDHEGRRMYETCPDCKLASVCDAEKKCRVRSDVQIVAEDWLARTTPKDPQP